LWHRESYPFRKNLCHLLQRHILSGHLHLRATLLLVGTTSGWAAALGALPFQKGPASPQACVSTCTTTSRCFVTPGALTFQKGPVLSRRLCFYLLFDATPLRGDLVGVQVWAADRSYTDAVVAARAECRGTGVRPSAFRTPSIVRRLDPESAESSRCRLGACTTCGACLGVSFGCWLCLGDFKTPSALPCRSPACPVLSDCSGAEVCRCFGGTNFGCSPI